MPEGRPAWPRAVIPAQDKGDKAEKPLERAGSGEIDGEIDGEVASSLCHPRGTPPCRRLESVRHTYDLTEVREPGRWDHSPPQMRKLRPDRWRLLKVGGREVMPEAASTSSLSLGAAVSAASPTASV